MTVEQKLDAALAELRPKGKFLISASALTRALNEARESN